MKSIAIKKLNNQGSTFVLAIIIITLVTTLALAILAASVNNINMKNVDRGSKDTFYTAESVMDEIRAGVGLDAMNNLGLAYEEVLTSVIRTNEYGYSYAVNNDVANYEFKSAFVDHMLTTMTGTMSDSFKFTATDKELKTSSDSLREQVMNYLNGYITGYNAGTASISSIGPIEAYKDSTSGITWVIIVKDMVVSYVEKSNDGDDYFAYITSDLEIEFPNMVVDFSNKNRIRDFIEYALVADKDLSVVGVSATVNSSIYAGNRIIVNPYDESPGSLIVEKPGGVDTLNVVCGGDEGGDAGSIIVSSNKGVEAKLQINGAEVWCTNIATGTDLSGGDDGSFGASIQTDKNTKLYVKDDLSIEGKNSVVNLNGSYYGYSYDGANNGDIYEDPNAYHASSSAIIVNGQNAKLTIGTDRLILGGHAYVDLKDGEDYMTGEALSFKGDQEVYLVPAKYLAIGYGQAVPNPMPADKWQEVLAAAEANPDNIKVCDTAGFFGNQYLKEGQPYTVRQNGNIVYIYLNFKSKTDEEKYISDIALGRNGADKELKDKLKRYTQSLFPEGGNVTINETSKAGIYTKGALLVTDNGADAGVLTLNNNANVDQNTLAFAQGGVTTYDEFTLASLDFKNRYTILTHLLASLPWTKLDANGNSYRYIVDDIDHALLNDEREYIVAADELTNTSMFDAIIDKQLVNVSEYNASGKYLEYGADGNYIKIVKKDNYTVPDDCVGGIIIATGSVTVNHNFKGLIIAGENININGNAVITRDINVEFLLTNEIRFKGSDINYRENVAFRDYFYAYKNLATEDGNSEQVKIETVGYKELVNYNNWRKYEDDKTVTKTEETE